MPIFCPSCAGKKQNKSRSDHASVSAADDMQKARTDETVRACRSAFVYYLFFSGNILFNLSTSFSLMRSGSAPHSYEK